MDRCPGGPREPSPSESWTGSPSTAGTGSSGTGRFPRLQRPGLSVRPQGLRGPGTRSPRRQEGVVAQAWTTRPGSGAVAGDRLPHPQAKPHRSGPGPAVPELPVGAMARPVGAARSRNASPGDETRTTWRCFSDPRGSPAGTATAGRRRRFSSACHAYTPCAVIPAHAMHETGPIRPLPFSRAFPFFDGVPRCWSQPMQSGIAAQDRIRPMSSMIENLDADA